MHVASGAQDQNQTPSQGSAQPQNHGREQVQHVGVCNEANFSFGVCTGRYTARRAQSFKKGDTIRIEFPSGKGSLLVFPYEESKPLERKHAEIYKLSQILFCVLANIISSRLLQCLPICSLKIYILSHFFVLAKCHMLLYLSSALTEDIHVITHAFLGFERN